MKVALQIHLRRHGPDRQIVLMYTSNACVQAPAWAESHIGVMLRYLAIPHKDQLKNNNAISLSFIFPCIMRCYESQKKVSPRPMGQKMVRTRKGADSLAVSSSFTRGHRDAVAEVQQLFQSLEELARSMQVSYHCQVNHRQDE